MLQKFLFLPLFVLISLLVMLISSVHAQRSSVDIFWLQTQAQLGNVQAQRELSLVYLKGDGVKRDMEKSRYWAEKALKNTVKETTSSLKETQNEVIDKAKEVLDDMKIKD